jgi:hypothetical protein
MMLELVVDSLLLWMSAMVYRVVAAAEVVACRELLH